MRADNDKVNVIMPDRVRQRFRYVSFGNDYMASITFRSLAN